MKRKNYKKHFVKINYKLLTVKDWMRENPLYFKSIKGVPTTNQIGNVLLKNGFKKEDITGEIIYSIV